MRIREHWRFKTGDTFNWLDAQGEWHNIPIEEGKPCFAFEDASGLRRVITFGNKKSARKRREDELDRVLVSDR